MSTRVVDQVDSWDDRSFSGGYRELQDLADDDFSGVVRAGGAELYMTRGVVVGIQRGDIEDFQSGGTVYRAPTDALPLLAIMQERSEEVRAKYYTEDTSIAKVDKTLSDGGFTGYVELSENVLSGDYYLVYHAGTSMSVAYVGESSRLIEGDEAFETANDEVGIYEVRPVDIEPIDIPEPEDDPADAPEPDSPPAESANPGGSPDPLDEPSAESPPDDQPVQSESSAGQSVAQTAGERRQQTERTDQSTAEQSTDEQATSEEQTEGRQTATARTDRQSEAGQESEQTETVEHAESSADRTTETTDPEQTDPSSQQARTEPESRQREQPAQSGAAGTGTETGRRQEQPSGRPQSPQEPPRRRQNSADQHRPEGRGSAERQDTETKTIPSLDPTQTSVPDDEEVSDSQSTGVQSPPRTEPPQDNQQPQANGQTEQSASPPPDQTPQQDHRPEKSEQPQSGQRTGSVGPTAAPTAEPDPHPPDDTSGVDDERLDELESELETKDEEIDRLETELASVTDERDELETELETLREERDELQSEVDELQGELQRLEEELGAATDADRRLSADEALAGTDIFVRYRSKGKATLEKAHGGSTRKEDVNENLRLEKHTQFDAETVAVGGQSYDEFLESTLAYQFVRWTVRELLFEIRDTGHEKALRDLYDVLPKIDRAELSGVVEVTYTEDGQQTQSQEAFDVVLRDRMGHPLLAANLNDTREATTESMMERLITSAERVGQSSEGFSGAFLVTESFFDPGALEIASDATQGGLLSRDKRKSFVNLSRKRGYHLCLVEARNENFHLAVPEL